MRLTELNPRFKEGVLVFDCPCDRCIDIRREPDAERNKLFCDSRIRIPIKPSDNGWEMTGAFPDTITLTPSIQIGGPLGGKCNWHGYLTNGEMKPC
jgi:hypothetical protein